ncbi:MAG: hypothetical protein QXF61_10505 [Nitrososphaeria archaeon]
MMKINQTLNDYKFLGIKGCLIVLQIIRNSGPMRYTDIEVEYIKKTGRKLSPGTLTKCLKELEKNALLHKSNGMYEITLEGQKLLLSLEQLSKNRTVKR